MCVCVCLMVVCGDTFFMMTIRRFIKSKLLSKFRDNLPKPELLKMKLLEEAELKKVNGLMIKKRMERMIKKHCK